METSSLHADWQASGPITLDDQGKLLFSQPPITPGAYELRLLGTADAAYVGETDNLRRRLRHYRNPGRSQRTNIRMNDEMLQHIADGHHIALRTCTSAVVTTGIATHALDLEDKASRQLVESAHILLLRRQGVRILNA